MTISPSATYTTRSGLPVRIYAVDGGGPFPVHGAYYEGDEWYATQWRTDGTALESTDMDNLDLIPAPREWKRWVVIEESGDAPYPVIYKSREEAVQMWPTYTDRIIEITIREPREGEA